MSEKKCPTDTHQTPSGRCYPDTINVSDVSGLIHIELEAVDSLTFDLEPHINWRARNKEEYDKIEKEINDFGIGRKHYDIHAWCDASGWDYWKLHGENYIAITVRFKKTKIPKSAMVVLNIDLNESRNRFGRYASE